MKNRNNGFLSFFRKWPPAILCIHVAHWLDQGTVPLCHVYRLPVLCGLILTHLSADFGSSGRGLVFSLTTCRLPRSQES